MERIFFKSDIEDAYLGLPIYVFDTSYLPSPDVIDYDLFIPTLMNTLPLEKYILVMFSCGLNKILWIHGVKFLRLFLSPETSNFDNLHKIIAVHESWFVKSIALILTNISISKKTLTRLHKLFDPSSRHLDTLISCGSLAELLGYVDITRLKISLNIYKHDAQTTNSTKISFNCPTMSLITEKTTYSPHSDPLFTYHFNQIFRIIDTYGPKAQDIFMKPGNRQNTEILFQCILRNQFIWINDWDLHCIALTFKKILLTVTPPLIDIDDITLPMKDDLAYTLMVLNKNFALGTAAASVLFRVIDLCSKIVDHTDATRHQPLSILKCMCHALTHELKLLQNTHRTSIAVRYIKNLILHWGKIRPLFYGRLSDTAEGCKENEKYDELYDLSHDITMEGANTSGEEENQRVQVNTKTILDNNTALALPSEPNEKSTPPPRPATRRAYTKEPSKKEKLQDVSNIKAQWPPQKYKFKRDNLPTKEKPVEEEVPQLPVKRPVVRGRKVGELTRLFEERTQAMKLLGAI